MDLRGRVALVTGAGHRVGRAIAVALSAQGMTVAVHFHSAENDAAETMRLLSGPGSLHSADLRDAAAAPELVEEVVEEHGQLDVLVNSAAVMVRTPLGEVTPDEWDAMFALNLRAPFFLSQAAGPHLRDTQGAIINIADLAAYETWPAYIPHGLTKAGVVHLTKSLARALAPEVRVNAVAPGVVLLPAGWTSEDAERLRTTTPLARLGTPDDVTRAVLYLLDADFVTGETIVVDGGRHVRT